MTKKEFERWSRLCQERHNIEVRGWLYLNEDCPNLTPKEKGNKYLSINFKSIGSELIQKEHFLLEDGRLIHYKWIKSIRFNDVWNWKDVGGKRDKKLEWVLKNLDNVSQG
jgi:hypothetical protein